MNTIQKIGMIILMQPDVDTAVTFYKQLGLKLKFHVKERWAEFDIDGVRLGMCPTSRPATELVRTGIVLEVADVGKMYQENKETMTFLSAPVEAVHGIMVSFQDPGGNILDLYQPTPEKVKELVKKVREESPADGQDGCCGAEDGCCGQEAES